jgi:hypothetical protein
MCSQTWRLVWWQRPIWGNELAVSCALRVGAATVDLEVRIWCLAIEYLTGCLRHVSFNGICILLHLRHVGLRIWRGEVALAFLKMLNLTRRVLCTYEAAVQAAHLVTFRGRVLVLKLSLLANMARQRVSHTRYGRWHLTKALLMSGLACRPMMTTAYCCHD